MEKAKVTASSSGAQEVRSGAAERVPWRAIPGGPCCRAGIPGYRCGARHLGGVVVGGLSAFCAASS